MNVVKYWKDFFSGIPLFHKHTVKNSWPKLQSLHRSNRKEENVWYFLKIQRILRCNWHRANSGWVGRSICPPRPTWRCRHVPKSDNLASPEKELWLKFCFKHKFYIQTTEFNISDISNFMVVQCQWFSYLPKRERNNFVLKARAEIRKDFVRFLEEMRTR